MLGFVGVEDSSFAGLRRPPAADRLLRFRTSWMVPDSPAVGSVGWFPQVLGARGVAGGSSPLPVPFTGFFSKGGGSPWWNGQGLSVGTSS